MTAHPSDRELADFVSDWLDEQSDSTLRQHLADCGTCRELVEKLRRGDTHKKMEPTAFASPEPPVGSVAADDSLAARLLANPPLPAAIPSRVVFPRGPTEEAPCGGIDHYDLVAALGQGTFGEVYLARDTRLGRQVAIKVLRPRFGRNAEFRRLLANEARLIAGVRGDHTVAVYDVHCGDDAGLSYIALEYVAGGSLNAYLAARRETRGASQPSVREIVELLRQGTLGVQSIHQRGYVHHDLKPSNLLVTTEIDGTGVPRVTRVKVADFGLVRSTTGDGRDGAGDVTAGTEIFMSPQRLAGEGGSDTRDDLYSLGVILFQLLTGRIPRMSDQSAELHDRLWRLPRGDRRDALRLEFRTALAADLRQTPPASIRWDRHDVDRDLRLIIEHCLEPDRDRRYPSAERLATDLQNWLNHRPISRRWPAPWYVMKCWGRRHPVAAVATGIILLSGGGLAVRQEVATHQIRQESLLELTAIEESIRQMKLSEASRRLHQLEGRLEGVPRLSELRERVQTQLAWLEPAIQNEERLARFDSLRHRAEETLIATEIDEFARGVEASDEALAIFELDQLDDWTSAPRLAGLDPSTRARILDEAAALQSLSIDQQLRRQFRGESALGIGAAIFQPKERPVTTGAVVDVSAGSPVVRAGLRVGDQILRGDGHWGWNPPLGPFGTALMSKGPRRVELLVLRRGQRQPEVIEFELEADQSPGMKVGPFEQLVIQSIAPNSELAAAGCQPGDAILAINGEPAGGIARLTEGRLTYEAFNACFSTLNAVNSAEVRLTIARPSTGEVREVPFASSRPRDLSRSRFHHNLLKALMSQEYARHVRTAEVTTTAPEFVLEQVFTARSWPVELTRQVADEVIREIAAHPVMAKAYASVARGDTQTPVADLWAWCDAHPGDVDANQLLLYCLQEGNRWGACVEVSSRAIARRPLVGVYWGVRGRAYANLRETIAARRDLERALVLHPTEWVKTLLENLARAGDAGG